MKFLESFKNTAAKDVITRIYRRDISELDNGKLSTDRISIDRDQHAQAFITVDRSAGKANINVKGTFWNGKDFDGDNFILIVTFHGASDDQIGYVRIRRGVDAKVSRPFKWETIKKSRSSSVSVPLEKWEEVKTFTVAFGYYDEIDDRKVGRKILDLLEEVFAAKEEGEDEDEGGEAEFA
ncbi:hypothetical protein QEZ48_14690 [Aquamicrobium lusatiense]|uniref:hypothetical protein n=1 Tax=Aquamicrobium lusatiense TaxID=89772 RepID=UPI00245555FA|nr:hypothetical protein [Aquamicrobium lusatiense]MDH4992065.1 hypothetical protein [Aquamicrobium lusatiense]